MDSLHNNLISLSESFLQYTKSPNAMSVGIFCYLYVRPNLFVDPNKVAN